MRRLIIVLSSAFAIACGGTPMSPEERTTRSKCGACHKRPEAGSLDLDSWEVLLEDHRKRFNISEEEAQRISAYLVDPD